MTACCNLEFRAEILESGNCFPDVFFGTGIGQSQAIVGAESVAWNRYQLFFRKKPVAEFAALQAAGGNVAEQVKRALRTD